MFYLSLMKIKLYKWADIVDHCENNLMMLKEFKDFYDQLEFCDWKIPNDIIESFRTADIVVCEGKPFNRVIFNIGGNKYRMICGYKFGKKSVVLYVRFIGSHKEYNKIAVCEVNMF